MPHKLDRVVRIYYIIEMIMRPISKILLSFFVVLAFSSPAHPDSGTSIKLAGYQFDPLISVPALPQALKQKTAGPSVPGYYILQFDGPVREEWKELCRQTGIEFLDYIPDFAFIVRMDTSGKKNAGALPNVRWLGEYEPAYRLQKDIISSRKTAKKGETPEFIIVLFPGSDVNGVIAGIEKEGGKIIGRSNSSWKTKLRVAISPDRIDSVAALSGVKWVEAAPVWQYFNDKAREIMEADTAWNTGSIFGLGQIVGVADTGLDRGSTAVSSLLLNDFKGYENGSQISRVLAISTDFTDQTSGADLTGHGTHVAGSVLGNGALSGAAWASHSYPSSCYAGIAPEASLVFQALGDFSKLPADLNELFAQAYGGGARIHNNSWGDEGAGEYTSWSEDVDEFCWDNKDFLIVFSAGNDGVDSNFDGVIDLYSVSAPATAKNCIAVGATENDRPPTSSPIPGKNLTYGWYWPYDFPAAPISDSYLSDNPDGMAALSSRGAQLAARWKPELVAPGTNVISCRTQAVATTDEILWGSGGLIDEPGNVDKYYVFSGGTSMSAPLVTGAAALVREYYAKEMGIPEPSAALVKATLINGAKDISPGQYGTGQYQEIPNPPRPNNVEGWGRVDLSSTIFSGNSPDFYYYDVNPGLTTATSNQYSIPVSASLNPLSVTLVWSDHPGAAPSGGALNNDLDLTVTGPTGNIYYPNNALAAGPLFYDPGSYTGGLYGFEGMIEAVRFTPERYPATIKRGMFYLASTGTYSKTFEYQIYNGSASGPRTMLASGTSRLRKEGWHIIDFSSLGITINSGDFFLAIVLPDDDLMWAAFWNKPEITPVPDTSPTPEEAEPTPTPSPVSSSTFSTNRFSQGGKSIEPIVGRSWEHMDMIGWYKRTTHDYFFRAVVETPTLYDRTNNTVGIDIDYPAPGNYTVSVSGYNVPYGPQPYALVVSRPDRGGSLPDRLIMGSGDYNGDGTSDIAVFRWGSGLWAIRNQTRVYFGASGDYPVPGDYDGDGKTDISIFRPKTALWSIRNVTRAYFGDENDIPVPADYNGDGKDDIAVFRDSSGLWAVRGISRFYYGTDDDLPVPGNYNSLFPDLSEAAIFRPSNGLWAIRELQRIYFGKSGDIPVPAHYDELPGDDIAIFRKSTGLWAVYDYSRYYFGSSADSPVPADYRGVGRDNIGIFRGASGLWAIRAVTRAYFGQQYDIPVTR